jgi:PBP1b-binding outer membrane lipoprotein LpoB
MHHFSTPAKLLAGAVFGVVLLTGCNKKPDPVPAPQTVNKAPAPTTGADPDLNKSGGPIPTTSSDANPGGTSAAPATSAAPDPHSTAQPPSSTTSTNQ